jgi:hypothetical protein
MNAHSDEYTWIHPECRFSYLNSGFVEVEMKGGDRNAQMLSRVGIMKDHPLLTEEERAEKRRHWEEAHKVINERALSQEGKHDG